MRTAWVAGIVAAGALACGEILGIEDDDPPGGIAPDAGRSAVAATASADAGNGDGSPDAAAPGVPKALGAACSVSAECESAHCTRAQQCAPANACVLAADTCTYDSDCCSGLTCPDYRCR